MEASLSAFICFKLQINSWVLIRRAIIWNEAFKSFQPIQKKVPKVSVSLIIWQTVYKHIRHVFQFLLAEDHYTQIIRSAELQPSSLVKYLFRKLDLWSTTVTELELNLRCERKKYEWSALHQPSYGTKSLQPKKDSRLEIET